MKYIKLIGLVMKVVSGVNNLDIVLEKLKKQLVKARKEDYTNAIIDKVKPIFYETLLLKTFVFYTNKNALNNSFVDADFSEIANKIIHIEDIEILLILDDLPNTIKSKYKISWLALEIYDGNLKLGNDQQTIKKHINVLPHFELLSHLNFYKKEYKKDTKKVFRIDIDYLESSFKNNMKFLLTDLLKNARMNFYRSVFNLQNDKELDSTNIVEQELKDIAYSEIKINKKDYKNIYQYHCQICNKLHQVVLSKSQKDKHNEVPKYVRVDNKFIRFFPDRNSIEISCNHSGTRYENINVLFRIHTNKLNINHNDFDVDKVFLFIFFNFLNNADKILFFKTSQSYPIEEYINNYENNHESD